MSIDYTVDGALSRLKDRCQFPKTNAKLSDDRLVQIMDEEIQTRLFPALMTIREDYCIAATTITIPAGSNKARLPIDPSASTLLEVRVVMTNNNNAEAPLDHLPFDRVSIIPPTNGPSQIYPTGFALAGDVLFITPVCTQDTVLRLVYDRRPSRLTRNASCNQILAVGGIGLYLTAPSLFPIYAKVDFVPSVPPLGILSSNVEITQVDNGTPPDGPYQISFTVTDETTPPPIRELALSGGGWVTPPDETCVFPLPDAWFSAWLWSSSATASMEYGATDASARFRAEADRLLAGLMQHQANRVRNDPLAVFDQESPQRSARRWNRNLVRFP